jgi:hypothetical protein
MNTNLYLIIIAVVLLYIWCNCFGTEKMNSGVDMYGNCKTRMSDSWYPMNTCAGKPVTDRPYGYSPNWHPSYKNIIVPNNIVQTVSVSNDRSTIEPEMITVVGAIDTGDAYYADSRSLTQDKEMQKERKYNRNVFSSSYYDFATPVKNANNRDNVVSASATVVQPMKQITTADFNMPTGLHVRDNQSGLHVTNTTGVSDCPDYQYGYDYNEFKQ